MEPIMMTVDETTTYLNNNISRNEIMRMARQKKIPAIKIGRHWYIHKEKLDRLVQQKTTFIINS